ncbi:MAG TPA: AAA family ATPase [Polyangia bacterium]
MSQGGTFVGREAERGEIHAALARAAAGQGGLLLLVGEPGIGKTRLADEASDDARARGFEVVWGRCWEGEAPPAYLPWAQVLRALPAPANGRPAALAPVLPELGAARPAAGEAAGFELLEAVLAELTGAAARRPHLVVFDDLHAADAGSLRLLEFVVRSLRGRPLLVLASYRDVEARLSPDGARLLGRIAREGRSLPLGRLAPDETAALAEARVGRALSRALVDDLQRTTEGNPLFVGETIELLAARGELERRSDAAPVIPAGVEDVIRGRLARLSAAARRALQMASVLGREHDAQLGAALIASHGVGDADAALDEAGALGFIVPAGARRRLSHALVRDAIYASLPAAERRTLHLAASRLYEAAAGADDAGFEAAHHALLALPEGGAARAVALAVRAAHDLVGRLAFEAAAEMYERALRALPVVPSDPLARCDLLVALSRCLISSGAVSAARARALDAAALARAAADGGRLAAAALAFGAEIRIAVVDPALIGLLEEALATLPAADVSMRPVVMARLAAARQPSLNPEAEADLARQAIALARQGGDPEVVLRTLHAALAALADYAPPAERLSLVTELGAAALARGDRALAIQARMRAFIDRIELGDVSGADGELAAMEGLAAEIGHARYLWRPLLARAMRMIMTGRFDEAGRLRAEAAEIAGRIEDPNFRTVHAMQAYGLALEREDEAELRAVGPRLDALLTGFQGQVAWRPVMIAVALVRCGFTDEARAEWARVPFEHPLLTGESLGMIFAGEVAAALGDRPRAAALEARLRHLAGHHATVGQMGLTWLGPVDRVLGLLAATRGALDEAEACLQRALTQARAVGAAPFVARVERELAALARTRGESPAAARGDAPGTPAMSMSMSMKAEGDVWVLSCGDRVLRLRASRGLAMLARLVAEPGRELHVLDLGGGGEGGAPGVDTGDAGPLLDAQARAAYRDRYADLEQAIDEAEADNDPARAARARAERERLADELARGVGLGGRERRAGAASERARVNVQRRLKDALDRITAADPELGRHLSRSVRTGTFCVYEP